MSNDSVSPAAAPFPALRQLTPVLVVESVAACIPFWIERLGFEMTASVPGPQGSLTFVILQRGSVELMYQSRESVLADGIMTEAEATGHSVGLFFTVESIDAVEHAIAGAPLVKARHETFYGSTEIYVKEPGGNTVGFAQMS